MRKLFSGLALLVSFGIHSASLGEEDYVTCFNETREIKYVVDDPLFHNGDYWQTPHVTGILKEGDCEDQVFFLEDLMNKKGVQLEVKWGSLLKRIRLKDGSFLDSDPVKHIWGEYTRNGEIVIMDPAVKVYGTEKELLERDGLIYSENSTKKEKEETRDFIEGYRNVKKRVPFRDFTIRGF